jgi:hypothetical protein
VSVGSPLKKEIIDKVNKGFKYYLETNGVSIEMPKKGIPKLTEDWLKLTNGVD